MDSVAAASKGRIGEILIETGRLDRTLLNAALDFQKEHGGRLGQLLVEVGFAEEDAVAEALARQLNLPPVQLDKVRVRQEALRAVDPELVERYQVLPVDISRKHKVLRVATHDPTNTDAIEALTFHTRMQIRFLVAGADALARAIQRYYQSQSGAQPVPTQVNVALQWPSRWGHQMKQMSDQLHTLGRKVDEQGAVIRSMLDLLGRKNLLSRQELRARMFQGAGRPPALPYPSPNDGPLAVDPSRRKQLLPELDVPLDDE